MDLKSIFINKKTVICLIALVIVGFIVRISYIRNLGIIFAFDQARDAFIALQIAGGDLKILGPSVSGVPNFYHGVLYYYLITIPYLIGGGNPIFVIYFLSFINSLVILLVYYLTKKMTNNALPAFIASLLFAVSFEQSQYATWLSNPTMGVWFVPMLYLSLYLWLKTKTGKFLISLGFFYGLSVQSNVSLAYHFVPISAWLWYSRKQLKVKQLIFMIISFILSISTMILVELKFGFRGIEGVKHLLFSQQIFGEKIKFGDFLINYLNHMGEVFAHNIFPLISAFGGLIGLAIIAKYLVKINREKKYIFEVKFLISWIFSYLVAASVAGSNIPHITAGIGVGFIILVSIFIWEIYRKNKVLAIIIMTMIIGTNVYKVAAESENGQTKFAIQKDLILKNEIDAVNFTYQRSKGEEFSISTLTSPLYVNTTWSYLYNWYGVKRYGYLPSYRGKDQIGQLGNNLPKPSDESYHFYIIEPTYGIPERYITWGQGEEDSRSVLIEEKNFGDIIVQYRKLK